MEPQTVIHAFEPAFDAHSQVLVLGTMPSPKSRENGFYYNHPQNRFWRVLADLLGEPLPQDNIQKASLLRRHRIALWDVLYSCEIAGADDSSIRQPVPNNLRQVLDAAPIRAIFTTGTKAASLYRRFCLPQTGIEAIPLPSTSPANCRHYQYEDLVRAYSVILPYLEETKEN